ncbi:MAG: hypothetical protein WD467_00540 [Candidatus Saccharimonadales bacterium]
MSIGEQTSPNSESRESHVSEYIARLGTRISELEGFKHALNTQDENIIESAAERLRDVLAPEIAPWTEREETLAQYEPGAIDAGGYPVVFGIAYRTMADALHNTFAGITASPVIVNAFEKRVLGGGRGISIRAHQILKRDQRAVLKQDGYHFTGPILKV